MKIALEPILYIDEQAQVPAAFCPRCLGELYAPSMICLRCPRDTP